MLTEGHTACSLNGAESSSIFYFLMSSHRKTRTIGQSAMSVNDTNQPMSLGREQRMGSQALSSAPQQQDEDTTSVPTSEYHTEDAIVDAFAQVAVGAEKKDLFASLVEYNAKRTHTPNPHDNNNKKLKSDYVADEDIAKRGTVPTRTGKVEKQIPPYYSMRKPKNSRACKCAIQVGFGAPIIGNPFDSTIGWKMLLSFDSGCTGRPSLSLDFAITEDGGPLNKNSPSWTVGWFPEVRIDNAEKTMIEQFWHQEVVTDPALQDPSFPPAIQEMAKKHTSKLPKLACITFTSNAVKHSKYDPLWVLSARKCPGFDTVSFNTTMDRLIQGTGSFGIAIWFLVPTQTVEPFQRDYLN